MAAGILSNGKCTTASAVFGTWACILLFLVLATASAYAQSSAPVGSISAIQGKVTITHAGKTAGAVFGNPVQVGDRIVTAPASNVTVTLSDGTQLALTESSDVVLDKDVLNPDGSRADTSVNLLAGSLRSVVRHAPGNAPNYQVYTPNASAAARGTDYKTDYYRDVDRKDRRGCREYTDVSVDEGVVEVKNTRDPNAPSVTVKKGQKTTIPCGMMPLSPSPATIAAIGVLGVAGGVAIGIGVYGGTGGFGNPEPPTTFSR